MSRLTHLPIFYINMNSSPEREDYIKEVFGWRADTVCRVRGTDGRNHTDLRQFLEIPERYSTIDEFASIFPSHNTPGTLALFTSHLRAVAAAYKSGARAALILEDDAFPLLPQLWDFSIESLLKLIPATYPLELAPPEDLYSEDVGVTTAALFKNAVLNQTESNTPSPSTGELRIVEQLLQSKSVDNDTDYSIHNTASLSDDAVKFGDTDLEEILISSHSSSEKQARKLKNKSEMSTGSRQEWQLPQTSKFHQTLIPLIRNLGDDLEALAPSGGNIGAHLWQNFRSLHWADYAVDYTSRTVESVDGHHNNNSGELQMPAAERMQNTVDTTFQDLDVFDQRHYEAANSDVRVPLGHKPHGHHGHKKRGRSSHGLDSQQKQVRATLTNFAVKSWDILRLSYGHQDGSLWYCNQEHGSVLGLDCRGEPDLPHMPPRRQKPDPNWFEAMDDVLERQRAITFLEERFKAELLDFQLKSTETDDAEHPFDSMESALDMLSPDNETNSILSAGHTDEFFAVEGTGRHNTRHSHPKKRRRKSGILSKHNIAQINESAKLATRLFIQEHCIPRQQYTRAHGTMRESEITERRCPFRTVDSPLTPEEDRQTVPIRAYHPLFHTCLHAPQYGTVGYIISRPAMERVLKETFNAETGKFRCPGAEDPEGPTIPCISDWVFFDLLPKSYCISPRMLSVHLYEGSTAVRSNSIDKRFLVSEKSSDTNPTKSPPNENENDHLELHANYVVTAVGDLINNGLLELSLAAPVSANYVHATPEMFPFVFWKLVPVAQKDLWDTIRTSSFGVQSTGLLFVLPLLFVFWWRKAVKMRGASS